MKKTLLTLVATLAILISFAQSNQRKITNTCSAKELNLQQPLHKQNVSAKKFYAFDVNFDQLNMELDGTDIPHRDDLPQHTTVTIEIPNPEGSFDLYKVLVNTTMHPDLRSYFPEIRTYDVVGINNRRLTGKIDITPHGFHAMIYYDNTGIFFIDPVQQENNVTHISYWKHDFTTNKTFSCNHDEHNETASSLLDIIDNDSELSLSYASCQLRTYRLALAATGEYTVYHGGTVTLAAAAQVTSMNRVNGVYERELAITMQIIANNNLLIYTNGATDPYSNGNAGAMLSENINNCAAVIGNANFDIGHVFGTNSGGVAYLASVCNNSIKAGGVTGSGNPIGDPFDIDYVAHEMGHQFGMNHTQNNNCNRNGPTAMETGSGITIMGYAGICTPNVGNNSIAIFHQISLSEGGTFISGNGGTCAAITNIPNTAPVITAINGGYTIPISTPFALTATATDANGHNLTYRWEQMDNQVSTQPPAATSTSGPNFRSFMPTANPTRFFPNMTAIINNGPFTWERLPSVSRTMNFRCTVHDDHTVGGCSDFINTTVTFDATAGPFVLTYPSATGINWPVNSTQTVTWNVANTTNTNVNCQFVEIRLSIDGGLTYPHVLAANVANNGSFTITVPNFVNTTSRVRVMAANGSFFDISDNNFTISAAPDGFNLNVTPTTQNVCAGTNAVYTIDVLQFGNFTNQVNLSVSGLPVGANASWSANPANTPSTSTFTITTNGVAEGTYALTITGSSTSGTVNVPVQLIVSAGIPTQVALNTPANNSNGVPNNLTLTWGAVASSTATYQVQVSTNPDFSSTVINESGITQLNFAATGLNQGTTYYWRVRATNTCGSGPWSNVFNFTTQICATYNPTDLPITIPTVGTITSSINITQSGIINNVDILNLVGTHQRMSDLVFTITSPNNTTVTLFSNICGNSANFNLNLSDNAAPGAIPCPPTNGLTYQPQSPLSAFIGENMQGTWTLTVIDQVNPRSGQLQSWSLGICYSTGCATITPTFNQVGPYCAGASIPALPTTSTNGVSGSWSPAINNTATTTYTFTPTNSTCTTNATMTIAVNPNLTPEFTQVGPYCSGASIPALPTTSTNGVSGTWSPALNNTATTTYTFTPTAGQCSSTATMTITINPNVTPLFNQVGPYCAGASIPALPTTSTNGVSGSWSPAINNTATTTYTFTPTNSTCTTNATMTITVNPNLTPEFTQVGPYCSGASIPALPTTSTNGVSGTWSPAINNTITTTYTFTPNADQCGTATTMTITVGTDIEPTFNQVGPYCIGDMIPDLPTTSINGFTGSWSPAINNMTTTTYSFTPNAGQCAITATMTIIVNPNETPTFNQVGPYCSGASIPALPTTSTNGVTGTWSPAINNTTTTTYTFTPNTVQCAVNTTMTITVNTAPNVVIQFTSDGLVATPGYASYAWSLNGTPIPQAAANVYVPLVNGVYEVLVSDQNGCQVIATYTVISVNLENEDQMFFNAYPNPSDGIINLEFGSAQTREVFVYDNAGKLVYQNTIHNKIEQLYLQSLAAGTYHLHIDQEAGTLHKIIFVSQ
jgi:subtilisin-like proprotein convertase family protein